MGGGTRFGRANDRNHGSKIIGGLQGTGDSGIIREDDVSINLNHRIGRKLENQEAGRLGSYEAGKWGYHEI